MRLTDLDVLARVTSFTVNNLVFVITCMLLCWRHLHSISEERMLVLCRNSWVESNPSRAPQTEQDHVLLPTRKPRDKSGCLSLIYYTR